MMRKHHRRNRRQHHRRHHRDPHREENDGAHLALIAIADLPDAHHHCAHRLGLIDRASPSDE